MNVFNGQKTTSKQSKDMLKFRSIGTQTFKQYVMPRILQEPSTTAPVRCRKLLLMAAAKQNRKTRSHKEKEFKQVTKCLRRRLARCSRTGQPLDSSQEQYSVLPRALADEHGFPYNSTKSSWTENLAELQLPLPQEWVPEIVIIDAMFLINTKPLRRTKTIAHYGQQRFALKYYQAGVSEVHLIFDEPGRQAFNPKVFEHSKRDQKSISKIHEHVTFTPDAATPSTWRDYIECRQCKRSLIKAIGLSYLKKGRLMLRQGQTLVIAGCFSGEGENNNVWIIHAHSIPESTSRYTSNAEEADMRIWCHATRSWANRILIYSPDIDVYNIGLGRHSWFKELCHSTECTSLV